MKSECKIPKYRLTYIGSKVQASNIITFYVMEATKLSCSDDYILRCTVEVNGNKLVS